MILSDYTLAYDTVNDFPRTASFHAKEGRHGPEVRARPAATRFPFHRRSRPLRSNQEDGIVSRKGILQTNFVKDCAVRKCILMLCVVVAGCAEGGRDPAEEMVTLFTDGLD